MSESTVKVGREAVEALKANWAADPCWDIEDTEGFEADRDELRAYRVGRESAQQAAIDARRASRAESLGLPGKLAVIALIERLEGEIEGVTELRECVADLATTLQECRARLKRLERGGPP